MSAMISAQRLDVRASVQLNAKVDMAPPPMFTKEQIHEIYKRQNNKVAAAGLKFLNLKMASEGKSEYELVATHDSTAFRTKIGRMYHGNIVAKPSDYPDAENRLFFVECKLSVDGRAYEAINCLDLGPANNDPPRCRCSCIFCRVFGLKSPIFHPPGFKIRHLLF